MEVDAADAAIKLAGTFPKSRFCLLEQWLPEGPEHPFAYTMLQHFQNLHSPLKSPVKYQTPRSVRQRFLDLGWQEVNVKSLWNVWSDNSIVTISEKQRINQVEPFDEWEEFALFSSHYFLLVADSISIPYPKQPVKTEIFNPVPSTSIDALFAPYRSAEELHRYSAVYCNSKDDIVCHGGYGTRTRLSQGFLYSVGTGADLHERKYQNNKPYCLPEEERVCHTICKVGKSDIIMIGGRTSPERAIKSCLWRQGSVWVEAPELPQGRFRHCSVSVTLPQSNAAAVLVYGGKTSEGSILDEWLLWSPGYTGWERLNVISKSPGSRFAASMSTSGSGSNRGHVAGGLDSEGRVLADLWEWEISISIDMSLCIECRDRTPTLTQLSLARFGASMCERSQCLYIVGGICAAGVISRQEVILKIDLRNSMTSHSLKLSGPEPLLVGHSLETIGDSSATFSLAIIGGGALCFSFGTFWNKGVYTVNIMERKMKVQPWEVLTTNIEDRGADPYRISAMPFNRTRQHVNNAATTSSSRLLESSPLEHDISATAKVVECLEIEGQLERFKALLERGFPVVLKPLNFGRCTDLWDATYISEKIGTHRPVIIHSSPAAQMDFLQKNFTYETMEFGKFISAASAGEKVYLRSVSSEKAAGKPTNLEDDFPTICADFALPRELHHVRDNVHSSPLRITGKVHMWLHYDALPNVYCQIRGRKRLALFHPSVVSALGFPHGASSSSMAIFDETGNVLPEMLPLQPYVCELGAGEALLIPAMWPHAAAAINGMSIAVNTFFRDLEATAYAAGKDIYANRDMQAYENGRREVDKIQRSFRDLPRHIGQFYLQRLAAELDEAAAAW